MERFLLVFQNVGENLMAVHQMEYYFDSMDDVKEFIQDGNSFIPPEHIRPVSLFSIKNISEYLKDLDKPKSVQIPIVKLTDEKER